VIDMAKLPLYGKIGFRDMPQGANTSLWYNKFCNQWESWDKGLGENKIHWINTVVGQRGDQEQIQEFVKRRKELVENNGGVDLLFRTQGKFVTGLGMNHPVENGFAWHHTLGTPYIPGTSVKGVVRDYARTLKEEGKITIEDIDRIFGPDNKNTDSRIGSVIFLDAIPVSPVEIVADIMTPHYGPYYSKNEVPGDWHSPNPIPFLVVDSDQEFLFGIVPRNAEAEKDLKLVEKWLVDALEQSGAGAKTAVGYGRFKHIEIKSRGEEWVNDIAREHGKDPSKAITELPKVIRERWMNIEDPDLMRDIAEALRKDLVGKNKWKVKAWGQLEKLRSALREYLGE